MLRKKIFGLIGYPLSHSFSEKYFFEKFQKEKITDCDYRLFPLKNISELPALIKNIPSLSGLNVTTPYKIFVVPYLNEIEPAAKKINAVNTIKIYRDNEKIFLKGFNTDIVGFEKSLQPLLKPHHTSALILGTGGAALSVRHVLSHGFKIDNIIFVSRNSAASPHTLGYKELNREIIHQHKLIINATPSGMYPDINSFPDIPYNYLTPQHLLVDLIYNPAETIFLQKGKEQGAQIKNGLEMLHLQADKAWEIWND